MSITDFLLARIAEDEREANVCLDQYRRGEGGSKRRWTRVLAECAAKRAIVEAFDPADLESEDRGAYFYAEGIGDAVKILAAVYADHPDYLDEWRVGA